MSELIDLAPPNGEEQDEIDALNDETFGCDLADINDDWENEHDKLTGFGDSIEGQISGGKSDETNHSHSTAQARSSGIEQFLNLAHSSKSTNHIVDDVLPQCEDLIKQSISNFILDDDLYEDDNDICRDFASYQLEPQSEPSPKSSSKIDKKNINLESLRPPSPSILPFLDDPFMSSVWRPLSPELNLQQQQQQLNRSATPEVNFIQAMPNDSKILTLEEIEKGPTINGHNDAVSTSNNDISKTKVFRLEDLEAQLLDNNKSKKAVTPPPAPNNSFMSASTSKTSNTPHVPTYAPGKLPPNIMEIAAMSLTKLSLQPPTIPSANKVVPPPPGLGSKFNLPPTTSVETQQPSPIPIHPNFLAKMPPPNGPDALQSQMAMASAMVNALANLSHLPTVRPPLPMMHSDMKLPPHVGSLVLDPRVQQEQQRIISKIITPAQAQRFYPSQYGHSSNARNQDRFAGFMTQKEKDWLVKIFRLQCKVNDPYVEDYYEVSFKVKKTNLERRQNFAKQNNKSVDDVEIDLMFESEPLSIVLPELAKVEEDKPKYIQFDNALGKIQVLNTKCPRKLLDVNPEKPSSSQANSYSNFLIKIERLYEYLLNIEDEDKRLPILPERAIPFHTEKRALLCQNLFAGLVRPVTTSHKDEGTSFILVNRNMPTLKKLDAEVDPDILNISKGLLLAYRSLFHLRDEYHLVVLLCSLLKGANYKKFVVEAQRTSQTIYGTMLIKAISRIGQTRNLIYIAASMDDLEVVTNNKQYGRLFLMAIFKQYQASDDKLLFIYFWKLFVQALMEHVSTYPELRQLCIEHYQYLTEL